MHPIPMTMRLILPLALLLSLAACKKEEKEEPALIQYRTVRYAIQCATCESRALAANGDTLYPFLGGALAHEFEAPVGMRMWIRARFIPSQGGAVVAVYVDEVLVLGSEETTTLPEVTYEAVLQ